LASKARAALSRFYFEDRIAPVSKAEYELAHADHHDSPVVEDKPKRKPKAVTAKK